MRQNHPNRNHALSIREIEAVLAVSRVIDVTEVLESETKDALEQGRMASAYGRGIEKLRRRLAFLTGEPVP